MKNIFRLFCILSIGLISCSNATKTSGFSVEAQPVAIEPDSIPERNLQVIDTIVKYGPLISPTYKKAVCTELVIPIVEKFYKLDKVDKNRIRIITNQDIQKLLKEDSFIPKGVYYALAEKGIGQQVDSLKEVLPGDFVQFWTETWGHCGVVKSVNTDNMTMELYSSFPSTEGYGVQRFRIPQHCYFVRLK